MDRALVDFGKTARDYAQHRQGFPAAFYQRLAGYGLGRAGQRVIDLGTGTGTVARQLARQGCRVIGCDIATPMLATARELAAREELPIEFRVAPAEATGLPSESADLVIAGQAWHWFEGDRVAAEAHRLLVPGGWLVIAHFDWLAYPGTVSALTEEAIAAHNPYWHLGGGNGMYPQELEQAWRAGFVGVESFSFDLEVPYTHESWRGRIRASAGVAASLPPERVEAFDVDHAARLAQSFPEDPLHVLHRVFVVLGQRPR